MIHGGIAPVRSAARRRISSAFRHQDKPRFPENSGSGTTAGNPAALAGEIAHGHPGQLDPEVPRFKVWEVSFEQVMIGRRLSVMAGFSSR